METIMTAAYLTGYRTFEMRKVPLPVPKKDELLIKVQHVGICGWEMHMFDSDGREMKDLPGKCMIVGHEAAGKVVKVGSNVQGFKKGDLVALEPGSTCGKCEECKKGLYNLCSKVNFFAAPGQRDGVFREYVAHPADLCFKLPANMNTMQGALIEPLAVGLHATELCDAGLGMDAVVFGAGSIGLMTFLALKARGVSRVAVCDVMDNRLEKANELGADLVINNARDDVTEVIMKWTNNRGADVVLDATGHPAAIGKTESIVKKAGTIALIGNPYGGVLPKEFNLQRFIDREITLKGVYRYRNDYPTAIQAVASGSLPIEKIADKIFPFEKLQEALAYTVDNKDKVVKTIIEM